MNKLQIISAILGDKFTPIVTCFANQEYYSAKPKVRGWLSSWDLNKVMENARLQNVRIAVDLDLCQFDFYFNN